jgi:hypothetical protein
VLDKYWRIHGTEQDVQEAVERRLCRPDVKQTPRSQRIAAAAKAAYQVVSVGTVDFNTGWDQPLAQLVAELSDDEDRDEVDRDCYRARCDWTLRFCRKKNGQPNGAWLLWAAKRGAMRIRADDTQRCRAAKQVAIERIELQRMKRAHQRRHNDMFDLVTEANR